MKNAIQLFMILMLCSCTMSHLRNRTESKHRANGSHRIVLKYIIDSNLTKDGEKVLSSLIVDELMESNNLIICNNDEECSCLLRLKIKDDQEVWSSWKVWVSGLSLGLVPVRFNANYEAFVKYGNKEVRYSNAIDTWAHLFLIPVFFVTPSKEMETKKLVSELVNVIDNVCR